MVVSSTRKGAAGAGCCACATRAANASADNRVRIAAAYPEKKSAADSAGSADLLFARTHASRDGRPRLAQRPASCDPRPAFVFRAPFLRCNVDPLSPTISVVSSVTTLEQAL